MENWQFLIQKQGDRSWQALESPSTDILEGRYRVLALSQLPNTDVEVRVTFFSRQEKPPRRRVQKRLRRTNADGLMAVIPFTYLKPGIWELRCFGDLMSDMLGQSWECGVYLQVLSEEVHTANVTPVTESPHALESLPNINLETHGLTEITVTNPSTLIATSVEQEVLIDEPVSPVWVKGETAEQILQNLIDLALPTSDPLAEEVKHDALLLEKPKCPLALTLDRETYVTRWGHVLTIHGRVEVAENYPTNQKSLPNRLYGLELRTELRSPQSLEILTQIRQSLADQLLPLTLRSAIDIPAKCESQLILADISLYGSLTDGGEVILLASQSFTITADVTQLLTVTIPSPKVEASTPPTPTPEPSISLDLELFNLVKSSPTEQSLVTSPLPSTPIPQSVAPTSTKKTADVRGLQLPKLPEPVNTAIAVDQMQPVTETAIVSVPETPELTEDEITVPTNPAPINLEQLVIKNRRSRLMGSSFPYLKPLQSSPTPSVTENNEIADISEHQIAHNLLPAELNILENTQEDINEDTKYTEENLSTEELVSDPNSEPEPVSTSETDDDFRDHAPEVTIAHSSPLIRKWMQSQGYSLPEPVDLPYPHQDVLDEEGGYDEPPVTTVEDTTEISLMSGDTVSEVTLIDTVAVPEIENPADEPESTDLVTVTQFEPTVAIDTPVNWIDQEIVVDDIFSENVVNFSNASSSIIENSTNASLSIFTSLSDEPIKPLPVPKLHVPEGELIAGNSVRVRVELPKVPPQVVVKLWVEDCQTRWLLDGPHLLTDLLPNSSGGMEVMIPLNIPFGCLEIRIEAIALNRATQQESHKVTVLRTVIPPDLRNIPLDELLGL
ncbi:hypothetical protein ACQFX9_18415 [Aliinostoc sp. HNIBRCY26]|uniref:hypothetical protein n=1 Tax=Aliinostoc sp. HNIBRCY26 TaxID=3418997 RepID=UPI003D04B933